MRQVELRSATLWRGRQRPRLWLRLGRRSSSCLRVSRFEFELLPSSLLDLVCFAVFLTRPKPAEQKWIFTTKNKSKASLRPQNRLVLQRKCDLSKKKKLIAITRTRSFRTPNNHRILKGARDLVLDVDFNIKTLLTTELL